MAAAILALRWMTTAHVVACLVLLWRDGRRERYAPYLALFLVGAACYLHVAPLLSVPPPYSPWVHLLVAGRGLVPYAFWLFGQALFDDAFRLRPWHLLVGLVQLGLHRLAFLVVQAPTTEVPGLLSYRGLAVLLAVATACALAVDVVRRILRQAPDDLVEARLRLRHLYVYVAGGYIALAVLVAGASFLLGPVPLWPLINSLAIYGLLLAFSLTQMRLDVGRSANRQPLDLPAGIEAQLMELIETERVYVTPGLTIGRLAERLRQPEHKVRALINARLGFRNFSAFLNSYRIREAERILRDPAQDPKTVADVAFALGYQSLGPFNRAFKEIVGQTPTEFRRSPRSSSPRPQEP